MYEKKKVLITLPGLQDPGGVAAFYNSLLPHLGNEEFTVTTFEVGSTRNRGKRMYPIADQLSFGWSLKKYRQDLVHINPSLNFKSFMRDGLLIYQAKLQKLPVLVFFHGWSNDFEQLLSKRLLGFFKKTFGKADTFIVLSGKFKKILQDWGLTQPIYLGTTNVDDSLLERISIEEKLKDIQQTARTRILFLSRLEREKGVFETIDAVVLLLQKGLSVTLSIAGDGQLRAEILDYIDSLGPLKKHVRSIGYVSGQDKANVFFEHDIFCFPTYYNEGLPTSVLEAMAFGLPVVTRPVAGIDDIFREEKMGFLCHGKTPEEIAGALEKLITNKSLRLKISQYNHTFAKEHFMASVVAKKMNDIYWLTINVTKR